MWLVQLQNHGNSWNPTEPKSRVVCACSSEVAAHKAGQLLVDMYNNPYYGPITRETIECTWTSSPNVFNPWQYAIKEHEGEWV